MGMKSERADSSVFIRVIRGENPGILGLEGRKWPKNGLKTPQNPKKRPILGRKRRFWAVGRLEPQRVAKMGSGIRWE